ncbi:ABC transporter substrate-binding protein [Rummeliibacillus sp. SL167]|uniref:ABC transporter substrate-binding protein n=1 Tax=Rummeliibacillus sp. SL167 TaxID=2579792 RepID=UPI0011B813B4|nr:ABC transporter substrate-binding protein [Rummeliibacillus sp. SL167]
MKKVHKSLLAISMLSLGVLAACGNEAGTGNTEDLGSTTLEEIEEEAKKEGEINSVGMPDTWANWVETWDELEQKYSLKQTDTDMSSAEEIAKFEAEKKDASADIGDVGIAYGPIAEDKDLTLAYKTSYWDEIPDWAKDDNGDWIVGYTGTIAFLADKNNVDKIPTSWKELLNSDYKVAVGDALTSNQAQFAILAAAYANGGDEKNIEPGIEYFAEIAKQGRLVSTDPDIANLEKGEMDIALLWDFNALGNRDKIDPNRFEVTIPSDASVVSGYTTIINKYAKNPHAAMLAREYILSDEGQDNLAKGYARPIRENVKLSDEAKGKLLDAELYKHARPVKDFEAWEKTTAQIPTLWKEKVLVHVK